MAAPAVGQVAVQLNDGSVLALGGEDVTDGFPVTTAQLYNPTTRQWSYAPDMKVGRIGETATVLRNGRVLVVGGLGSKLEPLDSAEVFDSVSRTWSLTAALPQTRFAQSATLLPDGRVLLVGGIANGKISKSSLFFDPDTGQWSPAPASMYPHAQQSAVVLSNGHVLLAGGYGNSETYTPERAAWIRNHRTAFRLHPVVVKLRGGAVLEAAGADIHDHQLRSARVYTPATGAWHTAGSLHTGRNQAVGALLPGGDVLVTGGEQVSVRVLRSSEVFNPASRTWKQTSPMRTPRDAAIATTLPDGTVQVCGGMNLTGVLDSCEIYHP